MSIEMVACIAIEAISILEKMHSKGYSFIIFMLITFKFLILRVRFLVDDGHNFIIFGSRRKDSGHNLKISH